MNMPAFSRANRARCESPQGFNHSLASWSASDWMIAMFGEFGEAANVLKKLNRVRDGIPGNKVTDSALRESLESELADGFIYLDLLCQALDIDLPAAIRRKFNAKSRDIGYPVVFDDEWVAWGLNSPSP